MRAWKEYSSEILTYPFLWKLGLLAVCVMDIILVCGGDFSPVFPFITLDGPGRPPLMTSGVVFLAIISAPLIIYCIGYDVGLYVYRCSRRCRKGKE